MSISIYPLLFEPVYKDYIWGGGRIPLVFRGKPAHSGTCAESWEISDRPEGMSVVSKGPSKGTPLGKLAETMGSALLGTAAKSKELPLLFKVLDAKERLSLQVHPNEDTAAVCGGEPKTEMWYVLAADQNARVFAGFQSGITRKHFEAALAAKNVETVLRSLPVKSGEAVFVPGGRVHAIGEGCLLLEVQQSSNTTYRVYDWDRVDKNGVSRELHIDKALQVINWKDDNARTIQPQKLTEADGTVVSQVVKCPFFDVVKIDLSTQYTVKNDGRSFHALFVTDGEISINGNGVTERLGAGTSCLAPAALENYMITPLDGQATVIRTSLV